MPRCSRSECPSGKVGRVGVDSNTRAKTFVFLHPSRRTWSLLTDFDRGCEPIETAGSTKPLTRYLSAVVWRSRAKLRLFSLLKLRSINCTFAALSPSLPQPTHPQLTSYTKIPRAYSNPFISITSKLQCLLRSFWISNTLSSLAQAPSLLVSFLPKVPRFPDTALILFVVSTMSHGSATASYIYTHLLPQTYDIRSGYSYNE